MKNKNIDAKTKDEIIEAYKLGEAIESLSARYDIPRQSIRQIVKGIKLTKQAKQRQIDLAVSYNYGIIQGREESAAFCKETIAEAEKVKKETVKLLGPFALEQLLDLILKVRSGEKELKVQEIVMLIQLISKCASPDPTVVSLIMKMQERSAAVEKMKTQSQNARVFDGPMNIGGSSLEDT